MNLFQRIKKYWNDAKFQMYLRELNKICEKIESPLISFPFLIFIELELPTIYERDGLQAAMDAAKEWPKKFGEEFEFNTKPGSIYTLDLAKIPNPTVLDAIKEAFPTLEEDNKLRVKAESDAEIVKVAFKANHGPFTITVNSESTFILGTPFD